MSYPIDEETDDVDDEKLTAAATDFQTKNSGPGATPDPFGNGSTGGHRLTKGLKGGDGNSSSEASVVPPAEVAINLSAGDSPTSQHYVGLISAQPQAAAVAAAKRSFFQQFYSPLSSGGKAATKQQNHHRLGDVEDPEEDDGGDGGGIPDTFRLTPKKPTNVVDSKKATDEELRPLSNGFVMQKS